MSYITPASFDPNVPLNVNISGQGVTINISGTTINAPVSGQPVRISGETVSANVSGNVINVSGQPANVSGNVVNVSGQPARISGETVAVNTSGNTLIVDLQPNRLELTGGITIPSSSGGQIIGSFGPMTAISVYAHEDNLSWIHIGGVSGDSPHTSRGIKLFPGDTLIVRGVQDLNEISAYANMSGDNITPTSLVRRQ